MKEKKKLRGGMTAEEGMKVLQSDPEWVRQNAERERKWRERKARLDENQKPIVDDLRATGFTVESVYDLVNTKASYIEAIPVLLRHLPLSYEPIIREGIARALTVKEARGHPARMVLEELKKSREASEEGFRFALANALTVIGDKTMVEEIDALMGDKRFRDHKRILDMALRHSARNKPPK